jgi:hypothetical protein
LSYSLFAPIAHSSPENRVLLTFGVQAHQQMVMVNRPKVRTNQAQ